jgi:hypothetical protein
MTAMEKTCKAILIDADVIFHFMANAALPDLSKILHPHPCQILSNVYDEVTLKHLAKAMIDKEIMHGRIKWVDFPNDNLNIKREFAILSQNPLIGAGERACMAVAKFTKNIIASSNFRDIAKYCEQNSIDYLGTLDILYIAHDKEIYTEQQCDSFIATAMATNKARFPAGVTQIRFYQPRSIDFIVKRTNNE